MNAMYIGFAREKTFLTEQLEKQGEELKRQAAEDGAAAVETQQLADTILDKFGYRTWNSNTVGSPSSLDRIKKSIADANDSIEATLPVGPPYANYEVNSPMYRWIFKEPPTSGTERNNNWKKGMLFGFVPKKDDVAAFSKMLETTNINFSWSFKVYGPFSTSALAQQVGTAKGNGYGNLMCGQYSGTGSYPSTYKGYEVYISGDSTMSNSAPAGQVFTHTSDGKGKNNIYTSGITYDSLRDKYFAVKLTTTVNVSTTGPNGTPINKTAGPVSVWKTVMGWQCATGLFQLPWIPQRGTNNLS